MREGAGFQHGTEGGGPVLQGQAEGRLDVAREALEAGLRISPQHRMMQDRLLEVLLALGDLEHAADFARRSLPSCPYNSRMKQASCPCMRFRPFLFRPALCPLVGNLHFVLWLVLLSVP